MGLLYKPSFELWVFPLQKPKLYWIKSSSDENARQALTSPLTSPIATILTERLGRSEPPGVRSWFETSHELNFGYPRLRIGWRAFPCKAGICVVF